MVFNNHFRFKKKKNTKTKALILVTGKPKIPRSIINIVTF